MFLCVSELPKDIEKSTHRNKYLHSTDMHNLHTHTRMHTLTHTHTHTHLHTHTHKNTYIYICLYIFINMYISVFFKCVLVCLRAGVHALKENAGKSKYNHINTNNHIHQRRKIHTHTHIYISSSSSCRAACADIPDRLSPFLPITHRLRQVFRITTRVLT